jgi:hypothetical protein
MASRFNGFGETAVAVTQDSPWETLFGAASPAETVDAQAGVVQLQSVRAKRERKGRGRK